MNINNGVKSQYFAANSTTQQHCFTLIALGFAGYELPRKRHRTRPGQSPKRPELTTYHNYDCWSKTVVCRSAEFMDEGAAQPHDHNNWSCFRRGGRQSVGPAIGRFCNPCDRCNCCFQKNRAFSKRLRMLQTPEQNELTGLLDATAAGVNRGPAQK